MYSVYVYICPCLIFAVKEAWDSQNEFGKILVLKGACSSLGVWSLFTGKCLLCTRLVVAWTFQPIQCPYVGIPNSYYCCSNSSSYKSLRFQIRQYPTTTKSQRWSKTVPFNMLCHDRSFCIAFDFIKNSQPGVHTGNPGLRLYWVTQRALRLHETYHNENLMTITCVYMSTDRCRYRLA